MEEGLPLGEHETVIVGIVFHVSDGAETMLLKPPGIRVTLCGCYRDNSTNTSSDAELHSSQQKCVCVFVPL